MKKLKSKTIIDNKDIIRSIKIANNSSSLGLIRMLLAA